MAFSSSASINNIASQYQKNVGSGSELQWSQAGLVADLESAQLNNAWSAQQAQIQRDYETQMSNTAHQREVADLQAAGLNPVLSANHNGATTPNGAVAVTDNGATGSGSKTATNALNAIVAQNNALVQANAAISSAAINASAMRYASDRNYDIAVYNAEHPNNIVGILRNLLEGSSGGSAKSVGEKLVDAAKSLFTTSGGSGSGSYTSTSSGQKHSRVSSVRPEFVTFNSMKRDGLVSNSLFTFKKYSSDYISVFDLNSYNSTYNSHVKFTNNNIKYNSFDGYFDYLRFCATFNLCAVSRDTFGKVQGRYLFNK